MATNQGVVGSIPASRTNEINGLVPKGASPLTFVGSVLRSGHRSVTVRGSLRRHSVGVNFDLRHGRPALLPHLRDNRTGQFTLRELAAKHGANHATIARRAEREGWTKDLTDAIRQATSASLINAAVQQKCDTARQDATTTVLVAAEINKQVILGHRADIAEVRNLAAGWTQDLGGQMRQATSARLVADLVGNEVAKSGQAVANAALVVASGGERGEPKRQPHCTSPHRPRKGRSPGCCLVVALSVALSGVAGSTRSRCGGYASACCARPSRAAAAHARTVVSAVHSMPRQ